MDCELFKIKTEPELIIDDANCTSTDVTSYSQSLKKIKSDEEINCNGRNSKFECENCGKCFIKNAAKERHRLIVHTHERSFSCDICKSTFVDKACVRSHMQQHIKYYCPICSEPFRHAFNIKRHMLVHNGLRPHRCNVCDRTYKHSSHLKRHLRHHEDGGKHKDTKPSNRKPNEEKCNKSKSKKALEDTMDMNVVTIESKILNKSLRRSYTKKKVDIFDRSTDILGY